MVNKRTASVLGLAILAFVFLSVAWTNWAAAQNEIYLSNDADQSRATYVLQFMTLANGPVRFIRINLPFATNVVDARVGRLLLGTTAVTAFTSGVDPNNFQTLLIQLNTATNLRNLTNRIELFNLTNPPPGTYSVDIKTFNSSNVLLDSVPNIQYSIFEVGPGDITAVNAGTGLTGGGTSGDVTLAVNTSQIQSRVLGNCPAGSSIRQIDATGNVVCQVDTNSGGTVVNVGTGSGLTGGPITATGTISIATGGVTSTHIADGAVGSVDVNPAQVQLRITGSCASGNSIRVVNQDGTVTCEPAGTSGIGGSGTVNTVAKFTSATSAGNSQIFDNGSNVGVGTSTPAAKLDVAGTISTSTQYSIGGARVLGLGDDPDEGNVLVGIGALQSNTSGGLNTAVGRNALLANVTGFGNTATGMEALSSNTTGLENTATGVSALFFNTSGGGNTANGVNALFKNTTGGSNTATGWNALSQNITGPGNTAVGSVALFANTTGEHNTATGLNALHDNTTGSENTASGLGALQSNTTGSSNTALGNNALIGNATGSFNTALGYGANVGGDALINATAIGANAVVDLSNKIRLGDSNITMIEAQVGLTVVSDKTKKENFQYIDEEEALKKIHKLDLPSWNFIGQDPEKFRHYGPMAQDFFAAFGNDGVGTVGTPTTINSGDMAGILMIAVQALEKRTAELKDKTARISDLEKKTAELKAKQSYFETIAARLEVLERQVNSPILIKGMLESGSEHITAVK